MLNQVLKLFSIVPDYDLNIMQPGQGLTEITCRILEGLKTYSCRVQTRRRAGSRRHNNDAGNQPGGVLSAYSCWSR
ncbi:hypothetical protein ACLB1M_29960 [Escherichia coli]